MGKIKDIFVTSIFSVKLAFQISPFIYISYFILNLLGAFFPAIKILIYGEIINRITDMYVNKSGLNSVITILILYIISEIIISQCGALNVLLSSILTDKAKLHVDKSIMQKYVDIDIEKFDDPKNQDTFQTVTNSQWTILNSIFLPLQLISSVIKLVSASIVILLQNYYIGIIYIIVCLPYSIIKTKTNISIDNYSLENIDETRKKDYYKRILIDMEFAKELRIYGTATYFKERFIKAWEHILSKRKLIFRNGFIKTTLFSFVYYVMYSLTVFYLVIETVNGKMNLSKLSVYIAGIAQFSDELNNFVSFCATQLGICTPRIKEYLQFLNWEKEITNGDLDLSEDIKITFKNVFFKYPNSEKYVLNGVSFDILQKQKIAFVGINGSGKTTIIKLILRFYKPERGEILLNNINIEKYKLESICKVFGVCFQEVVKYSLNIRESIGFFAGQDDDIDKKVIKTLHSTGLSEKVNGLDHGIYTQLTRLFDKEGIELSGGQWQKLSIARSLYKNSRFIIMDEPSAFLDVESEDDLFNLFYGLSENKGGIIISHRLTGIINMDQIFVLENGSIIENGTHNQLLTDEAKYAKMYKIQADKYKIKG